MRSKHKEILEKVKNIIEFISSAKKFSRLIPEVRTNVAVASPDATSLDDIAGVDGRITIVQGMPKAAGPITFGATNHTGRLLLTARKFDPTISAVINIRYSPKLIENLSRTHLLLVEIDRTNQPMETQQTEDSSMSWIINNVYQKYQKIPDIIWDTGEMGKEPMVRLFAKNSDELIEKIQLILNLVD
ncbi:MAG: hypothetical protein JW776_01645 [Candidatus Lokiarchaeota archaeon]|nr:hypothetical protein [Candidatus Lokiarchaeota archaeon]